MHSIETQLMVASGLLIFSVISSKAIGRLGIPALLVFLGIGMLAGSEGIGGIYFDNALHAKELGIVALIYILFSGGLNTHFKAIKPVLVQGALLATMGILVTCTLVAAFVVTAFDFTWLEGMLLGAIVSSTDAAAVFTILRGRNINLKGKIAPLLELESGANDPMAVFLTVGILQLLTDKIASPWGLVPGFFLQIFLGTAMGLIVGRFGAWILNRLKLEFDGLYPVLTLALVVLTYGATETIGGNGFLAVYLVGLVLGNQNFIHKKSLLLFHDGVAWLMQIGMFLVLGLLVFPSRIVPVAGKGLIISIFLILVARPLAVFISLLRTSFSLRERAMISWVGLRGSVPIILATYPYVVGIEKADQIFHLVFFIVLTSVLIQGSSISIVAKWLKVDAPAKRKILHPLEFTPSGDMKNDLVEIEVPKDSKAIGKSIFELGLPKEVLVVLIQRQGDVIVPKGGTHLEALDILLVLSEKDNALNVKNLLAKT